VKRHEFEHVIKAAADIAEDEIVVIGSQAILAQFPEAPNALLVSMELDVYPRKHVDRADEIDGAIGEGSRFHETYSYYAHGVGPETPTAPAGWEGRLIPIELPAHNRRRGNVRAWCMEAHDLVLAKLAAGRPHDIEFATVAVSEGLVDPEQLELGLALMPEEYRERTRERLVTVRARQGRG
jgi:hypothetical protein